jgi:hypothetical protein
MSISACQEGSDTNPSALGSNPPRRSPTYMRKLTFLLAVTDDLDPAFGLASHDLRHGLPHLSLEHLGVVGLSMLLRPHRLEQVVRPCQASHVGSQDALAAPSHTGSASAFSLAVVASRLASSERERTPSFR